MKRWKPASTTWVAVVLTLIAGSALVVAIATASFDNWAPNIATEALSIAVTIAVVERIVRRENRRRIQPRVDRALRVLSSAYIQFTRIAIFDYASTHLTADLKEMPEDPVAVLGFWQERYGREDAPRARGKDGRSLLLSEGVKLVRKAQLVADSDRELLPPDLVIALDNLSQTFSGHGELFVDLVEELPRIQGLDDWLCLGMVQNAREFGDVLRHYAPDWFKPAA